MVLSPQQSEAVQRPPVRFPWSSAHGSQQCECWVDVEGGPPGNDYDYGNKYDSNRNNNNNKNNNNNNEQRRAAMRAPGLDEGKDEVVVETMIQVSSARPGPGFF